mmetsp:Transcript_43441/g.114510  ORF Transcript_43441/g.114510 Transcript_43441/m.114510 type:complete len:241 (+) Transcript_43441:298-1020(+)
MPVYTSELAKLIVHLATAVIHEPCCWTFRNMQFWNCHDDRVRTRVESGVVHRSDGGNNGVGRLQSEKVIGPGQYEDEIIFPRVQVFLQASRNLPRALTDNPSVDQNRIDVHLLQPLRQPVGVGAQSCCSAPNESLRQAVSKTQEGTVSFHCARLRSARTPHWKAQCWRAGLRRSHRVQSSDVRTHWRHGRGRRGVICLTPCVRRRTHAVGANDPRRTSWHSEETRCTVHLSLGDHVRLVR